MWLMLRSSLEAAGDVDHKVLEDQARAALASEGFTTAVIEEELGRSSRFARPCRSPPRPTMPMWPNGAILPSRMPEGRGSARLG